MTVTPTVPTGTSQEFEAAKSELIQAAHTMATLILQGGFDADVRVLAERIEDAVGEMNAVIDAMHGRELRRPVSVTPTLEAVEVA